MSKEMIYYIPIIGNVVAFVRHQRACRAHSRTLGHGLTPENLKAFEDAGIAFDKFNVSLVVTFGFLFVAIIFLQLWKLAE